MSSVPALVLHASMLGMDAFKRGAKRIPCVDRDCLALIGANDGKANLILRCWLAAWDDANLSAGQ